MGAGKWRGVGGAWGLGMMNGDLVEVEWVGDDGEVGWRGKGLSKIRRVKRRDFT